MSYHTTYEGKILPCRHRVRACCWPANFHADTKEELYPLALTLTKTVEPSQGAASETKLFGGVRTWSSMSRELETSPAPVELIVASLGQEIQRIKTDYWKHDDGSDPQWVTEAEEKAYEIALNYHNLSYDDTKPSWLSKIPDKIWNKAKQDRTSTINDNSIESSFNQKMNDDYNQYARQIELAQLYRDNPPPRTPEEKRKILEPMINDFNHYAGVLNASKIISKRHFADVNKNDEVEAKIQTMCDAELLMTYDDYTVDDAYIARIIRDVDAFGFNVRKDISAEANNNLLRWHSRQQDFAKRYTLQSAPRILLAIKLYKEIERRNLQGGDLTADNINKEKRSVRYDNLSTPEQLERDRIEDEEQERREQSGQVFERVDTSKRGWFRK